MFGGEEILGPGISAISIEEGATRQYFQAGLIAIDPLAAGSDHFRLELLSLGFDITEDIFPKIESTQGRIINVYLIISDFLEIYERLGGARIVGKPISSVQYNPFKGRVEQYYENLGFYRLKNEPVIRTMPYGVYACDKNCRNPELTNEIPIRQPILPPPFLSLFVAELLVSGISSLSRNGIP